MWQHKTGRVPEPFPDRVPALTWPRPHPLNLAWTPQALIGIGVSDLCCGFVIIVDFNQNVTELYFHYIEV